MSGKWTNPRSGWIAAEENVLYENAQAGYQGQHTGLSGQGLTSLANQQMDYPRAAQEPTLKEPTLKSRAEEIEKSAEDIESRLLQVRNALFETHTGVMTNGNTSVTNSSVPTLDKSLRNITDTVSRIQSLLTGIEQKIGGR